MNQTSPIPKLSPQQWFTLFSSCLGLLLINTLIEQSLNQQLATAMEKDSASFAIIAGALFCNGIGIVWLQSIVLVALVQTYQPETSAISLATKMSDFTKEWLRAMGETSLWTFAFIIPGLIRLVDYSLLPFVCFYHPAYQRGEIDALRTCRSLAKGRRGVLWALWIGLGLLVPLILTALFGDYESFNDHPLMATLLVTLDAAIQILSFWLIWMLYRRATNAGIAPHKLTA